MQIHAPRFSRRGFLRALGQGALLAALPREVLADQPDLVTISILHTTDLHGHILPTIDYAGRPDLGGLARCATQIGQWRGENPHHVAIDVGDVYQGTEEALATRGRVMIDLLNALRYDAWVIGNHEFDWGIEPLAGAITASAMPVLSGNCRVTGGFPSANLKPYSIREVAGFRLAIIGLTTPGLASWLPPENLRGFEVLDPSECLRRLLVEVAAQRPDAVIVAGHMGLKRQDDFANRVGGIAAAFPDLTVWLGGHTHQNQPSVTINGVLYTQADHFGIHAGKVDLTFDRATRRLVRREAITVEMTHDIAFDPAVLALARPTLDDAARVLAQPIGELTEPLDVVASTGQPSDVERLIGSAMRAALRQRGVEVDLIAHGLFEAAHPLSPGGKTVADAWSILPYENRIVTLDLTRPDLLAVAQEVTAGKQPLGLMGLRVVLDPASKRAIDLRAADGSPLPEKKRYRVALNSYDAQSGGQRLLRVARLARDPANGRHLHPIETRTALIDFFATRGKVGRASLLV